MSEDLSIYLVGCFDDYFQFYNYFPILQERFHHDTYKSWPNKWLITVVYAIQCKTDNFCNLTSFMDITYISLSNSVTKQLNFSFLIEKQTNSCLFLNNREIIEKHILSCILSCHLVWQFGRGHLKLCILQESVPFIHYSKTERKHFKMIFSGHKSQPKK